MPCQPYQPSLAEFSQSLVAGIERWRATIQEREPLLDKIYFENLRQLEHEFLDQSRSGPKPSPTEQVAAGDANCV